MGNSPDLTQGETELSPRLARWSAMLRGEPVTVESIVGENLDSAPEITNPTSDQVDDRIQPGTYLGATGAGIGVLAMLCNYKSRNNKTVEDEIAALEQVKSSNPSRNIFSRSARFKRRHENVSHESE